MLALALMHQRAILRDTSLGVCTKIQTFCNNITCHFWCQVRIAVLARCCCSFVSKLHVDHAQDVQQVYLWESVSKIQFIKEHDE